MAGRVEPVPEGLHTVVTRLVFDDATAAIAFYQQAFGATVPFEPHKAPDGSVVIDAVHDAEIREIPDDQFSDILQSVSVV